MCILDRQGTYIDVFKIKTTKRKMKSVIHGLQHIYTYKQEVLFSCSTNHLYFFRQTKQKKYNNSFYSFIRSIK